MCVFVYIRVHVPTAAANILNRLWTTRSKLKFGETYIYIYIHTLARWFIAFSDKILFYMFGATDCLNQQLQIGFGLLHWFFGMCALKKLGLLFTSTSTASNYYYCHLATRQIRPVDVWPRANVTSDCVFISVCMFWVSDTV